MIAARPLHEESQGRASSLRQGRNEVPRIRRPDVEQAPKPSGLRAMPKRAGNLAVPELGSLP